MVCVRCKKRTAVVFIQRMDNGKPVQEGYCLTCAREMHIQPVDDLMKQFGMSDQDLENMEERMSSFLQEAAESGMLPTAAGEDAPEEGENSQAALIMAHVRRYLEDNYMFDLSLDSVGEILHISPAYLSAQFKKYQKMNFLDCLTELRINAAKELLTDPFRSSAEVASMVGYEDASYFARAFKKRTGMTPTQYRRQVGQKAKSDPEAEL